MRQLARSELSLANSHRRRVQFLQQLLAAYCAQLHRWLAWTAAAP